MAFASTGEPIAKSGLTTTIEATNVRDFAFSAAPDYKSISSKVGDVTVRLETGQARTLILRWTNSELGDQENFVHFHCPGDDEEHGPGLTNV